MVPLFYSGDDEPWIQLSLGVCPVTYTSQCFQYLLPLKKTEIKWMTCMTQLNLFFFNKPNFLFISKASFQWSLLLGKVKVAVYFIGIQIMKIIFCLLTFIAVIHWFPHIRDCTMTSYIMSNNSKQSYEGSTNIPFHRSENWSLERISNLSSVTQLVHDKAKYFSTYLCDSRAHLTLHGKGIHFQCYKVN